MFYNCTSLTSLKVAFTKWNVSYTSNWVVNVASEGTFIKSKTLDDKRGTSYIP